MVDFSLIHQIFIFLTNLVCIWLAFWILFANKKAKINQLFFILALSMLLWIDLGYLSGVPQYASLSLLLARLRAGGVFVFFIAAYFFSVFFPKKEGGCKILDSFILLIGIFFCSISIFTNLIIENVEFKKWGANFILGKWEIIFYSIVSLLTFLIISSILRKYFKISKGEKLKIQYFLIGIFLFVGFNLIFNIALPFLRGTSQFYQVGDYSLIFFLGFTAYAIVKRELFGIKVVLTGLFVSLMGILLLLDILFLTPVLLSQLFKGLLLVIFLYFGYLLIKSIIKEIEYREKLQIAYSELKKLDKAKTVFLSIASHQLRTPLTAIKGYISLILENAYGKLTETIKKPMENVYQSNERLIKLVNEFLNISRIEAGRMKLNPEKIVLEDIISNVIQELKIEAEEKNIYLKLEKPTFQQAQGKKLPKISLDKEKIRQVILNIVNNAIKYTNKGGITIKIQNQKSKIQIIVSDTGAGMTKEEKDKLFESFSRGAAGTRLYTEGAGLGLYIAKKFIEMHQGKIRAESKGKDKGSTFFIELPVK